MAKIHEVFGGNFLKADDLQGKQVRVTIDAAEIVEFDDGRKVVLTFVGKEKRLVCNKTNSNIIAENIGSDDTDDWHGHSIVMAVKKVEFQGKLVPAIRVILEEKPARQFVAPAKTVAPEPKPVPVPAPSEPEHDDVPF